MTRTRRHQTPMIALLLVAVLSAAGCATPRADAVAHRADAVAPTSPPIEEQLLTTGHPLTVIGRGEKVELCLGGVLESLPPGCAGGIALPGWDWDAVEGQYEESGGVRWGEFVVTGTYDVDAETFTPVQVGSGADHERPHADPAGEVLGTRCDEPEGGWRILDATKATQEALHSTTDAASRLDGYAITWLDRSLLPPVPDGADTLDALHHYAVNSGLYIINVAVKGDAAAAEAILRKTWGGALCVVAVDYSQADLDARFQELTADGHPWIGAHVDGMTGVVRLTVARDVDGALQREVDEKYGPGLVRITSVLKPVAP